MNCLRKPSEKTSVRKEQEMLLMINNFLCTYSYSVPVQTLWGDTVFCVTHLLPGWIAIGTIEGKTHRYAFEKQAQRMLMEYVRTYMQK